jgi:hypothetical protein
MSTLDYQGQTHKSPSRIVPRLAHLTLLYPLLITGGFVVEWLVAWAVLGHKPQPMVDDPKGIAGAQIIHIAVLCLLLSSLPAFVTGAVVNVMYIIDRRPSGLVGWLRLAVFWIGWSGLLAVLQLRPFDILEWWWWD